MGINGLFALLLALITTTEAVAIEVDSGVPSDQARSLRLDLEFLRKLQFQQNGVDQETGKLLKIEGHLDSSKLQNWLDERVSLIVSESMDLGHALLVAPGRPKYPEPRVLPIPDEAPTQPKTPKAKDPSAAGAPASEPVIVMANMGSAFYMLGKERNRLLVLKKTDGGLLPLASPRDGFIQIGKGLFLEQFRVNRAHQDTPANAISRLSTLFHESRHSDGQGRTLAFMHAFCPEKHAYAGHPACDKNSNGPYSVGAQVLRSMIQACGDCSTRDKTVLKLLLADLKSRVLQTFRDPKGRIVKAKPWNDGFERITSYSQMR